MAASLIIGGVDVSAYIAQLDVSTSPYTSEKSDSDTTTFKNWDGTVITYGSGGKASSSTKTSISAQLKTVPHKFAESIASVLKASSISVSYTSPVSTSGMFECTSCRSDCRKFAETWDMDISLESKAASGSASGGSL